MSVLSDLRAARAGWIAALARDAIDPQPTVTASDGKKVERNEWREGLLKRIQESLKLEQALNPFLVKTIVRG